MQDTNEFFFPHESLSSVSVSAALKLKLWAPYSDG